MQRATHNPAIHRTPRDKTAQLVASSKLQVASNLDKLAPSRINNGNQLID